MIRMDKERIAGIYVNWDWKKVFYDRESRKGRKTQRVPLRVRVAKLTVAMTGIGAVFVCVGVCVVAAVVQSAAG